MNWHGASGVDGETIREFEKDRGGRINDLHERAQGRSVQAPLRCVALTYQKAMGDAAIRHPNRRRPVGAKSCREDPGGDLRG